MSHDATPRPIRPRDTPVSGLHLLVFLGMLLSRNQFRSPCQLQPLLGASLPDDSAHQASDVAHCLARAISGFFAPQNPREKQFKISNMLCISTLLPRAAYIVILFQRIIHSTQNDQFHIEHVALTGHNQVYTKGAIYRQMQEYSRKAVTAESRLEELHKRSVHHDDHLRIVDAWWRQVCGPLRCY